MAIDISPLIQSITALMGPMLSLMITIMMFRMIIDMMSGLFKGGFGA
jgi:hypothetical protein